MEEKDQQPIDPGPSNKPVEHSSQLPDSSDIIDISDQSISLQEPDSKIILRDEPEKQYNCKLKSKQASLKNRFLDSLIKKEYHLE